MRRLAYRCKTAQKYLNRQKLLNSLNVESSESPLNAYSMLASLLSFSYQLINNNTKFIKNGQQNR
jgi:hypothetical protein